jgi:hypothetical protein
MGSLIHMEQLEEWELAGETEVLGGNLLQCHIVDHKPRMTWPEIEAGSLRLKTDKYPSELWHGLKVEGAVYWILLMFHTLEVVWFELRPEPTTFIKMYYFDTPSLQVGE